MLGDKEPQVSFMYNSIPDPFAPEDHPVATENSVRQEERDSGGLATDLFLATKTGTFR